MFEEEGYFVFNKHSRIVLYGAATIGILLYERLSYGGFNIIGFIDKRADELKDHNGKPVYAISDEIDCKEDVIVIVAVKNVFEHSRIAKQLKRNGWRKIIYIPYNSLNGKGSEDEQRLYDIYNIISDSRNRNLIEFEIPYVNETSSIGISMEGMKNIGESGEKIVYVPSTMLFTDKKNNAVEFSILLLKPHLNFIKFVFGDDGGEYKTYMDYCISAANKVGDVAITEKWKENVLRNRSEVFTNMFHKLNVDSGFFIENAPNAKWDDKNGYFNLISGKHRATFLAAVGMNYIPIKIDKNSFNCYMKYLDVEKLKSEYEIYFETGYCPISENPYFVSESWAIETFWFNVLNKITAYLYNKYYIDENSNPFEGKCAYIDVKDGGFFKRYFCRVGLKTSDIDNVPLFSIEWERVSENADVNFVLSERMDISFGKKIFTSMMNGKIINLYVKDNC